MFVGTVQECTQVAAEKSAVRGQTKPRLHGSVGLSVVDPPVLRSVAFPPNGGGTMIRKRDAVVSVALL